MSRWHWTDLLLTLILALVFGVLYWAWGFVWDAVAFSNTLVPGLRDLFYGFWLSAGIVAAAILRRPGAAIATQTLAVVAEMALNNQWSPPLLAGALAQGGLVELLFALTRYKRYDVRALMFAGAAGGLGSLAVDWIFRRPDVAVEVLAIKLVARAIGGALLAGWLGNALVNLTAATGVLDRLLTGDVGREPG